MKQELTVTGYEETLRSSLPDKFATAAMMDASERVQYLAKEPKRLIDPFFFLSRHVIRPKRQD